MMDDFRADFQVVLDDSLTQIEYQRDKAEAIYKTYNQDQPEFDAAYQIFRDLEKAHDELNRTRMMIVDGMI